ncbi:hypothetical protein D9M71_75710 [compost metagenome]
MPPNGIFSSARPPIQKSMASTPEMVKSSAVFGIPSAPALFAQTPVLWRKSRRSTGSPTPPNTRSVAAARFASSVVALVMEACVP